MVLAHRAMVVLVQLVMHPTYPPMVLVCSWTLLRNTRRMHHLLTYLVPMCNLGGCSLMKSFDATRPGKIVFWMCSNFTSNTNTIFLSIGSQLLLNYSHWFVLTVLTQSFKGISQTVKHHESILLANRSMENWCRCRLRRFCRGTVARHGRSHGTSWMTAGKKRCWRPMWRVFRRRGSFVASGATLGWWRRTMIKMSSSTKLWPLPHCHLVDLVDMGPVWCHVYTQHQHEDHMTHRQLPFGLTNPSYIKTNRSSQMSK